MVMFFHNVKKKKVHGDIAHVGKMAAKKKKESKHFVSEAAK